MDVRINNPDTCKAIAKITKDPSHQCKCPIIMSKDTWSAIKPAVMCEKERYARESIKDLFGGIFGDFFGNKK